MIVFHADLDNTLIYSYKRDIGREKVGVEIYQNRVISYMTPESHRRLKEISKNVLLIPTTTRTAEQYGRIDLGIETPLYALVCNGGVLLKNGCEDADWYEESLRLTADCRGELIRAEKLLQQDADRSFEVRNVKELFVFTKSDRPDLTAGLLRAALDLSLVDVFQNGVKVYVLPKSLTKGCAVRRMQKRLVSEAAEVKLRRGNERSEAGAKLRRGNERSAADAPFSEASGKKIRISELSGSPESGENNQDAGSPIGEPFVIAAGDSEFDVSMAGEAELFMAPSALREQALREVGEGGEADRSRRSEYGSREADEAGEIRGAEKSGKSCKFGQISEGGRAGRLLFAEDSELFSDFVLRNVQRIAAEKKGVLALGGENVQRR